MMRMILAVLAFVAVCSALPATGDAQMPCICTMEYAPVCGVDGVTYSNKCGLDCAGVELAQNGECPKLCPCPRDYMPVCGQDGKTYSNQCEMNCAGVELAQTGECPRVCACPRIYMPVCGQDGKTYSNQCEMNCAGVAYFQDGACTAVPNSPVQKRAAVPCVCTFQYDPVCGSDGITYGNKCSMNCEVGVTEAYAGQCKP